jgi:hypothetical protein
MIALNGILGHVDTEAIDRQTLVRIIQIRDFRRFSPDLIERLTYRAEQEFGSHSPQKPIFDLHPWEKKIHVYFQTHRSSQRSYCEYNLTLMAKVRYFQWMKEYTVAAPTRKAALMNDALADMHYWQTVYLDYVRYLELPEPTDLELLLDCQRMIEDFKVGASPEDVKLIDLFAQSMIAAGAGRKAGEAGKTIRDMLWKGLRTSNIPVP